MNQEFMLLYQQPGHYCKRTQGKQNAEISELEVFFCFEKSKTQPGGLLFGNNGRLAVFE